MGGDEKTGFERSALKSQLEKLDPAGSLSLCMVSFVGTIGLSALMILPILVGSYIDYLGFAEDTAGWISAANLAGIAVMTLVVSLKTNHWPLVKITGYGLAVMILFDILTMYFQSLQAFTVIRFLSGMGGGAAQAAVAAAIARLLHSDKGYGIYIGFQFLLPAIGLFAFPAVLPEIGFNGMMQVIVALEVLSLLMVPVFVNYRLPAAHKDAEANSAVFEIGLILQKPAMLSIIGLCVYGAANAAIWAYAERMGLNAGLSSEGTGNVLSAVTGLGVFGAFTVIWLQDKFGHIRPLTAGIACQIVAMLIMIGIDTSFGYVVGVGLYSIAWAFTWPYFLSIQADLDRTGTVVVAGQFSNLVGNSLGPAMAAFLVGGGTYVPAIWMACGLFVASLMPMLAIARLVTLPSTRRG